LLIVEVKNLCSASLFTSQINNQQSTINNQQSTIINQQSSINVGRMN